MAKLMPVLFQGRPVSCSVLLPGAMSYQGPSSFPLLPRPADFPGHVEGHSQ